MGKANLTHYIMVCGQSGGSFSFFQISLCYLNLAKAKLKKALCQGENQWSQNHTRPLVKLHKCNWLPFPLWIKPRAPQMSGVARNPAPVSKHWTSWSPWLRKCHSKEIVKAWIQVPESLCTYVGIIEWLWAWESLISLVLFSYSGHRTFKSSSWGTIKTLRMWLIICQQFNAPATNANTRDTTLWKFHPCSEDSAVNTKRPSLLCLQGSCDFSLLLKILSGRSPK